MALDWTDITQVKAMYRLYLTVSAKMQNSRAVADPVAQGHQKDGSVESCNGRGFLTPVPRSQLQILDDDKRESYMSLKTGLPASGA